MNSEAGEQQSQPTTHSGSHDGEDGGGKGERFFFSLLFFFAPKATAQLSSSGSGDSPQLQKWIQTSVCRHSAKGHFSPLSREPERELRLLTVKGASDASCLPSTSFANQM